MSKKYNPTKVGKKGKPDKAPLGAERGIKYGHASDQQRLQTREVLRRSRITSDTLKAKRELKELYPLYSFLFYSGNEELKEGDVGRDDEFNDFLKNSLGHFYDINNQDNKEFTPQPGGGSSSRKLQLLFLMAGLVTIANSVYSDPKVKINVAEMLKEFMASLKATAEAAKTTVEKVVDAGSEFYSSFKSDNPATSIPSTSNPIFTVGDIGSGLVKFLAIPTFGKIVSTGKMPTVTDIVTNAAVNTIGSTMISSMSEIGVEGASTKKKEGRKKDNDKKNSGKKKDRSKKKEASYQEFLRIYNAVMEGNLYEVERLLALYKQNGQLESILSFVSEKRQMSLFYGSNYFGYLAITKAILAAISDDPELLEKVLTSTSKVSETVIRDHDVTPLYEMIARRQYDLMEATLNSTENYPKLIEKLSTIKQGFGQLSIFYYAPFIDIIAAKILFKFIAKHHPQLFNELIQQKPEEKSEISIINLMLLYGDQEILDLIIKNYPVITRENLPISYHSNAPHGGLFYIEAFLSRSGSSLIGYDASNQQVSYQQLQNGQLVEVSVDDIRLSPDPILINLTFKSGENRRVISANDVNWHTHSKNTESTKTQIQDAINFAESQDVRNVVMNVSYENHAITLKLMKDKDNRWVADIHDQHDMRSSTARHPHTEIFIKTILEPLEIKKVNFDYRKKDDKGKAIGDRFPDKGALIPAYASASTIKTGNCDITSSMVSASFILGPEHATKLRSYCDKQGLKCIEELGKVLNPEVDKILDRRLAKAKERVSAKAKEEKKERKVENDENKDDPNTSTKPTNSKPLKKSKVRTGHDEL